MKLNILLIAAGQSARLGRAKQLLPFKDSVLIKYVIDECIESDLGEVYVVLGAYANDILPFIKGDACKVLVHEQWSDGMSSTIAYGIRHMSFDDDIEGVIIVLSDQIYFNKELLFAISKKRKETQAKVIISKYQEGQGPPSFFDKRLFEELKDLKGDNGAKSVVHKYKSELEIVRFPKGNIDIDEPVDLQCIKSIDQVIDLF